MFESVGKQQRNNVLILGLNRTIYKMHGYMAIL
jgi:hypothetical protein